MKAHTLFQADPIVSTFVPFVTKEYNLVTLKYAAVLPRKVILVVCFFDCYYITQGFVFSTKQLCHWRFPFT